LDCRANLAIMKPMPSWILREVLCPDTHKHKPLPVSYN
jgi:hypothetical protein